MIFDVIIWYVELKSGRIGHVDRKWRLSVNIFQEAVESLFVIRFWWNKRHYQEEYVSFQ